jgi:hypothetical protein
MRRHVRANPFLFNGPERKTRSRLERWDRAHDIGLEPPVEVRSPLDAIFPADPRQIKEILLTQQGQTEDRYAQTVLHNHDL